MAAILRWMRTSRIGKRMRLHGFGRKARPESMCAQCAPRERDVQTAQAIELEPDCS
ncbi:hypothetical protein [Bradyrhizobium jicamae]|uniref:hypothetical protein n=1 Tax=Bradyrhizobium jicamae TaxID=280332 RepID=UPI001BA876F0|nr:hypothetical protein [Bradyrhizobium jicamae]MBR0936336.1 hypothetical protein [Bradyrhizobium jicamae]